MPTNPFEDSRVVEGTMRGGEHHSGTPKNESRTVSRDDVRDGFAWLGAAPGVASKPYSPSANKQSKGRVLAASTLVGDRVRNCAGEELGTIDEIMVDLESGSIAYAVLSHGGFLGIGCRLFAVPWSALRLDRGANEFILDVDSRTLERAPCFDKDDWPDMADPAFESEVHQYYGRRSWRETVTRFPNFTYADHFPEWY